MSRQDVLALLREQEGAFVSGEEISHRLGLSRAAIWKAVDALRREGYTVEARTGRGYRLLDAPDVLTEPEIRRFLGETARVGRTLVCLAEVDSTNLRARQLAAEGAADGTVVVADRQTGWPGPTGPELSVPRGQGIYLTALLRPDLPPERLSPVTAMAGVAVCRAVERLCGVSPGLKWPNDPVLDGKKLCGILTELSLEGETAACRSWCWASESMSPSGRRISRPRCGRSPPPWSRPWATLCPGPPWRRRSSGRWTASAQPWRQERLVLIWPSTGGGA